MRATPPGNPRPIFSSRETFARTPLALAAAPRSATSPRCVATVPPSAVRGRCASGESGVGRSGDRESATHTHTPEQREIAQRDGRARLREMMSRREEPPSRTLLNCPTTVGQRLPRRAAGVPLLSTEIGDMAAFESNFRAPPSEFGHMLPSSGQSEPQSGNFGQIWGPMWAKQGRFLATFGRDLWPASGDDSPNAPRRNLRACWGWFLFGGPFGKKYLRSAKWEAAGERAIS